MRKLFSNAIARATQIRRALWIHARNVWRAWLLVYRAAPLWTIGWIALALLQGFVPVVTVYLTRPLVNSLVATINSGGAQALLYQTLLLAVLYGALLVAIELFQVAAGWIRTGLAEIVQDHTKRLIHTKSAAVDLAFYHSPEYYDRLYRAGTDASTRPLALLESTGSLLQNALTLVGIAALLAPYGAWIPLALVVSTLPALYIVFVFNRRTHRWWNESTPKRRWSLYFDAMLTHGDAAAELRLFDLGPHFQDAYQALRQTLRGENLRLVQQQSIARVLAALFSVLVFGGVMLWMLWRALNGLATLGDLALFYQAFNSGQNLMRALLNNLGELYRSTLFLGNLFEFLELEPQVRESSSPLSPPASLRQGLTLRNVTFRYAPSQRPALENFSLAIPPGKIVAIVGPNGAGKSTLIKLLCRFYDPQSGAIELDGINLQEFSLAALRKMISVLFQEPVPYHATARENIALADLAAAPTDAEIESAARSAGAHELIARLPRGYDMLLGKWYADGIELSAGEWQRIALARAYLRRAQIILLDEPTSFMDSWSEADWFDRFRALAQGRTALLITHRFTVAMRADIIHVMDGGHIVESGSHAELVARGGLYAQSWRAQMQSADLPSGLNPANGRGYESNHVVMAAESSYPNKTPVHPAAAIT